MNLMIIIKKINVIIFAIFVSGCSLAPGMHLETTNSWLDDNKYVYIEALKKDIKLINISEKKINHLKKNMFIR